jgi:hypothetical protein
MVHSEQCWVAAIATDRLLAIRANHMAIWCSGNHCSFAIVDSLALVERGVVVCGLWHWRPLHAPTTQHQHPPNMHHSGKQRSVLSQKIATVPPQWGVSYLRHRHGFAVKIDGGIEAGVRLQAAACNHTVQA